MSPFRKSRKLVRGLLHTAWGYDLNRYMNISDNLDLRKFLSSLGFHCSDYFFQVFGIKIKSFTFSNKKF